MKYAIFLLAILSASSCSKKETLNESIKNMYGRIVIINSNDYMVYTSSKADEKLAISCNDKRLIIYHDSTKCSVCELKNAYKWQEMVDRYKRHNTEVVMIFNPKRGDVDNFKTELKNQYLVSSVLLDTCGCFIRDNPFISKSTLCHTFLVDKQNKIVLVGDPNRNDKIKELFYQITDKR